MRQPENFKSNTLPLILHFDSTKGVCTTLLHIADCVACDKCADFVVRRSTGKNAL